MAERQFFDQDGNRTLLETTDDSGSITGREYYRTDENGESVIERREAYYRTGALQSVETYRPDGSMVEQERLVTGHVQIETERRADGTTERITENEYDYDEEYPYFDGKTEHIFNEDGVETEQRHYDRDNRLETVSELDAGGRVTTEYIYPYEKEEPAVIRYTYDPDGNRIMAERTDSSDKVVREVYSPDEKPAARFETDKNSGEITARLVFDAQGNPETREEYTGGNMTERIEYDAEYETATVREYDENGEEISCKTSDIWDMPRNDRIGIEYVSFTDDDREERDKVEADDEDRPGTDDVVEKNTDTWNDTDDVTEDDHDDTDADDEDDDEDGWGSEW